MNRKQIGNEIEERMIVVYHLDPDLHGFDASLCSKPVEIKGCTFFHNNGVDYKYKEKTTYGRFWINNHNHWLLSELNGYYIFCLYHLTNNTVNVTNHRLIKAKLLDTHIGRGKNTKIAWNRIFDEPFKR
ncbi:MAG: hypothetical protein DRN14_04810 [Thermoplasmata archaeon]|nr:MAG: hypothetical protein DRN14_04810 [Thermoplasmata archaeon]